MTYSTIHATNLCPSYSLLVVQYNPIYQYQCYNPAYPHVLPAEQAIIEDYVDLQKIGGYCLFLKGKNLLWGGHIAAFESGTQEKVWFS